jgi:hypothetical protein
MRKALSIIVLAAIVGIGFQAIGGSTETIVEKEIAGIPFQNGVSVYGLHVALPEYLVPLP